MKTPSYPLDSRLGLLAAILLGIGATAPSAVATDSRLPDGTEYVSWEQPLQFSKTYYVDGNSARSNDNGPGTSEQPFRTISKAAEVLQPGQRVVIASGVYRECVCPARGGTGPDQMISYEAAPGATVFVRGSDALNDGWQPAHRFRARRRRRGPDDHLATRTHGRDVP